MLCSYVLGVFKSSWLCCYLCTFKHKHLINAFRTFLFYVRGVIVNAILTAVVYQPNGKVGMSFLQNDTAVYAQTFKHACKKQSKLYAVS